MSEWIGVDLDGTLAHYGGWVAPDHIGEPITPMVERVKLWLAEGKEVKIFTARVDESTVALTMSGEHGKLLENVEQIRRLIQDWCEEHIGVRLPVTNQKDYGMIELWDDRAVRVKINTGCPCCEEHQYT